MLKTLLAIAVAFVLSFTAAPASNALDIYGRAFVGVADVDLGGPLSLSGDTLGAAIGVDDIGPFRLEASATHLQADAFLTPITAWNLAGTAYLDIPLGSRLTVSPNAGLDYVFVNAGFGGSASTWGWHYGVQASTPLTDTVDLTAGWTRTNYEFSGLDVSADAFTVGVRFGL